METLKDVFTFTYEVVNLPIKLEKKIVKNVFKHISV